MHANETLISNLYAAFARRDGSAMNACYHEDATFSDPIFTELKGEQIGAMWTMFCLQAPTLEIKISGIKADDISGQARWIARYGFGKPPRPVYNRVRAEFKFQDGLIIDHRDHFKLWKWSRMALGPLGLMLGWHSGVQEKIRHQAMKNLTKFISSTKNA